MVTVERYIQVSKAIRSAMPTIKDVAENVRLASEQLRKAGPAYAVFMEAYKRKPPKA